MDAESPVLFNCIPPGLDTLLEAGQLVVHMGNLRHDAGNIAHKMYTRSQLLSFL
jgi:hypothetical protein